MENGEKTLILLVLNLDICSVIFIFTIALPAKRPAMPTFSSDYNAGQGLRWSQKIYIYSIAKLEHSKLPKTHWTKLSISIH